MKIYIAGHFPCRYRLRPFRDQLQAMGHLVVSSWLDTPDVFDSISGDHGDDQAICSRTASRDMADIAKAQTLILDTIAEDPNGGREVEFGLAEGLPRYIVGPYRNVFHRLASHRFNDWEECLAYFASVREYQPF